MKVLHLSTFDIRGGAARGAYWLHRALAERGLQSEMLVGRKYSDDPTVSEPEQRFHWIANQLRGRLDALPLNTYKKTTDSYWTLGWIPDGVAESVARHDPDIVHVHWTGGGFMSVESLRGLPYPVVWTLRDMWAFTGGCHYTAGCGRYAEGCGFCPQLHSKRENDLSRRMWRRKRTAWDGMDLWLVPISRWLSDCVAESNLYEHVPVEVIPNGIDTGEFHPTNRMEAKKSWSLSLDRQHILFGAIGSTDDPRKGFHHLLEAIRIIAATEWAERAELVVFGGEVPDEVASIGMPVRSVGQIDDNEALARLYSACDVMVTPSEQEAFGKTLIEAMACGSPVVAFGCGGPLDIVAHEQTGYLADPFDVADLAAGILWCIEDRERNRSLGLNARAAAEEQFDIGQVADSYRALYRQILARAP